MFCIRFCIRKYARSVGHVIVGKLTRIPLPSWRSDVWARGDRLYIDQAGNEYIVTKHGEAIIVTADGGVI